MEKILSQIDGAGRVEAMLTIAFGEEKLYQYDEDTSVSDTTNSMRKTVIAFSRVRIPSVILLHLLNFGRMCRIRIPIDFLRMFSRDCLC